MKKKVIAVVLIACMSISAAACGKSEEPKAKTEVKTETKEKEKKEYQKIGVEAEGAFSVLIKNNMGSDITGIAIKTTAQTEYPANMMKSEEVWKNGDTVELFYTPDSSSAPTAETDKAINVGYSVQLTLVDGRVVELTTFGFEDMEEKAELCFEDEVGFVKYVSKTSGDEMSTKEQEINVKAQREAEAQAQAAAAQAQAEAEAAAAAQAQAEAEAAAAAQAQQEYVPEYTAPSNPGPTEVAPQQNTGGGCLGGVVIN
ncbi:MAG: hypothetical protein Q4B39_05105 [[Ruminococcus] gnavus]|nr:hypothetical protein [Mediterraneibacter gnavus]